MPGEICKQNGSANKHQTVFQTNNKYQPCRYIIYVAYAPILPEIIITN